VTVHRRPEPDLERVAQAERQLWALVGDLDEDAMRAPCALPDWSRGHLLTHLARNADSHVRRAEGAARGEVVDQYPGGFEGRAADIERGAARPAGEILADVAETSAAVRAAWNAVPEDAWGNVTRDVGGRERPLDDLVRRRWQEVEVHLVDLDLGFGSLDWSDDFVAVWVPRMRADLPSRLPEGVPAPAEGSLDARDELAWLYGRLHRDDLPTLGPWT
jgi:maleylpyruvate isomerase